MVANRKVFLFRNITSYLINNFRFTLSMEVKFF